MEIHPVLKRVKMYWKVYRSRLKAGKRYRFGVKIASQGKAEISS